MFNDLRQGRYTLERGPESAAVGFQGITHEAIIVELPLTPHREEASVGQHFEMLRTGRLRHWKTAGQFTAAALARSGNRLQNTKTRRVCQGFGNSHHLLLVHGLLHRYIAKYKYKGQFVKSPPTFPA